MFLFNPYKYLYRDAQLQQYTADFAAERRVHSQESADAGGCDKCSENLAALNRSLSECKSNTNGRGTKTLPLTSLWGTSWESNKTGATFHKMIDFAIFHPSMFPFMTLLYDVSMMHQTLFRRLYRNYCVIHGMFTSFFSAQ